MAGERKGHNDQGGSLSYTVYVIIIIAIMTQCTRNGRVAHHNCGIGYVECKAVFQFQNFLGENKTCMV